MLNKAAFQERHPGLTDGMKVYGRDGENLGKIQRLDDDSFLVEKGFFFPKDFSFRYDDIDDLRNGDVYVKQTKSDLSDWSSADYTGWTQMEGINQGDLNAVPREE